MSNNTMVSRRTVMSEANALVKSANMNRSQAVKQGYKVAKVNAIFAAGMVAVITFLKADGTLRVAQALPARTGEYLVKGTGCRTTPRTNLLFVDADLGEFRSCAKARILDVSGKEVL